MSMTELHYVSLIAQKDRVIERQAEEIARLRKALKQIKDVPKHRPTSGHLSDCAWCNGSASIAAKALRAARAARGDE